MGREEARGYRGRATGLNCSCLEWTAACGLTVLGLVLTSVLGCEWTSGYSAIHMGQPSRNTSKGL